MSKKNPEIFLIFRKLSYQKNPKKFSINRKLLQKEGHEHMLVVGGTHITTSFLRGQLLKELRLILEPKIF